MADVAIASGLTEESVRIALGKLANADLLVGEFFVTRRAVGSCRRSFLKKGGIAIAVATVISITAPLAAQAQSAESRYDKCSNQACDERTACSLQCTSSAIRPSGCTKTQDYSCRNFDALLVPDMCAVYCDCS